MNEWWRLCTRYPQFKRHTHALLKEYGYMRLMDLFDAAQPKRALEFGHGFNPTLLQHGQAICEMHGIDDDQQLVYFPSGSDWQELYDEHIAPACTSCTLHRGLLGSGDHSIKPGSMDIIASVSVLEELEPDILDAVVADCASLLAPGGRLAGTFDLMLSQPDRLRRLSESCAKAGLTLPDPPSTDELDWNATLLESPSVVMCTYQMGQPDEGRAYSGHWTAAWFVAEKPA